MRLNPQQEAVVRHVAGPCLVTAVPGSGKTASLTERVRRLVESGVDPRHILAITFTNKAAKEMKDRILAKVGDEAKKMTVSTFHSLCARILRQHPTAVGLGRNFTILDGDDQKRLLESCFCKVRNFDKKRQINREEFYSIFAHIERVRNACLGEGPRMRRPWMREVVAEYFRALKASNAVDFTGLLSETLSLFEKFPLVLERYQRRWEYISVDEVQDTNVCQYRIVSLLAAEHKNLLFVGDLCQSIYKFRHASPENILQFEEDFGAKILKLEKNYRSTPQILAPAQRLIEHNSLRKDTKLVTDNPPGASPQIVRADSDHDMAMRIASYVDRRIRDGVEPREIAVLYRVNAASRLLEQALRSYRVKYKVIGDVSFFDRQEIKTSLSILRFLCNEDDRIAFERTVDFCCKGAGARSLSRISEIASEKGVSIAQAAREFGKSGSKQAGSIGRLLSLFAECKGMRPDLALVKIAKGTGFWRSMEQKNDGRQDRCENIAELALDVRQFVSRSEKHTLERYLQEASLTSASDEESSKGAVNLMTMHACKGLEFDVVVISHAMQGIVPHDRSLATNDPSEIEEERRLFYVAMTRARHRLIIAYSLMRGGDVMAPSQFLAESGLS